MQKRRLSTIEVELYSRHFAFQSACIHVTQEFLESLSTDAALLHVRVCTGGAPGFTAHRSSIHVCYHYALKMTAELHMNCCSRGFHSIWDPIVGAFSPDTSPSLRQLCYTLYSLLPG